jgi:tRNA-2-methylthio-N6-dimethylallyladenosine synthase
MRVDEAVKQSRLQRINALGETHALNRSRRFLGRVLPVLVEDVSLKNPRLCVGRIPHSRLCYFEGEFSELKGQVVDVEITEAKAFSLVGRRVAP